MHKSLANAMVSVTACSHRRRGQDKTVASAVWTQLQTKQDSFFHPCRRCEQAISCRLETASRRDKTHRNWVETRQFKTRQFCLVGGV